MKQTLLVAAALVCALFFASCSTTSTKQETVYTIDQLYLAADSLVGDTVLFEGVCSHLCKHGGRKAFLLGQETLPDGKNRILRVEGAKMGNFDAACINNIVRVKGVLHKREYIPAPATNDNPGEQHGANGAGCETERTAIRDYFAEAVSYTIVTE